MQFVILAHSDDETALRVYAALCERHGMCNVKLVSGEELALAPHWAHRLEHASSFTELSLHDGTDLSSNRLRVVFNRLQYAPMPHFADGAAVDRDYAITEMYALWLSWLASLPCPVVNQPTPRGLGAQNRGLAEWLLLAAQAGLPARAYHFTSDPRRFPQKAYPSYQRLPDGDTHEAASVEPLVPSLVQRQPACFLEALGAQRQSLLIAGQRVVGALAAPYGEAARRLATLAGCDLLQVVFGPAANEASGPAGEQWKVCEITSFPQVRDREAVAAIVDLLEARQARMVAP
jgi:hypothetical protein